MKTYKTLILEEKSLIKSKHWKKCWAAVQSLANDSGLPNFAIIKIKSIAANVIGKISDKEQFKDVVKKEAADDEIDESSITAFNKIYNKILLEADDKKQEVDSGTDATGDVYYLRVKNGKGAITDKDGAFVESLKDETLSEFIKKLKKEPAAFKPGETIRIGSADDAKEDEADKKAAADAVLKLFDAEACSTGDFPEIECDGYEFDEGKVNEIVKANAETITKKIKKNKEIRKGIDIEKIEDKAAVSQFVYATICCCVCVRGIKVLNTGLKKADDDAKKTKEEEDKKLANPKTNTDWINECKQFQMDLPATAIASECDANWGDATVEAMNMYNCFGTWTAHWDTTEIDSKRDIRSAAEFLNTGNGTEEPAHPQAIREFLNRLLDQANNDKGTKKLAQVVRPWYDRATALVNKYPQFKLSKLSDDLGFTENW